METLVRIRLNGSATKRNSKYAASAEFLDLDASRLILTHEVEGAGSKASAIIAREIEERVGEATQRPLKDRCLPLALDQTAIREYAKGRLAHP